MNRLRKMVYAAVVLLAVAVVVNLREHNYKSVIRLLRGESRLSAEFSSHFGKPKSVPSVGSPEARVKIRVMAMSANHCHEPTIDTVRKVAGAAPSCIRFEFVETDSKEGEKFKKSSAQNCMLGITVNGKPEMDVMNDGVKQRIGFHGPLGMGTVPLFLKLAVETELARQYPEGLNAKERKSLAEIWRSLPKGRFGIPGGAQGPLPGVGKTSPPQPPKTKVSPPGSAPK